MFKSKLKKTGNSFFPACPSPYFGTSCKNVCNCLDNATCNNVNGTCPRGGCQKGWKGDSCNIACKNGSYGYNCNETCSGCVSNQCDIIDGNCSIKGKCNPGWVGPKCNEPCEFGFFGEDCASVCHCIIQTCNHTSGVCPSGGCKRGYIGGSCSTNCSMGHFGFNCNESCDGCLANSCDKVTGNCTNTTGCKPGWQHGNSRCDIACNNGSYGYNCNETCTGCVSNLCDKIYGNCIITGMCNTGWVGPKCNEPCKLGFFGEDCASVCHCFNQTCNHTSGLCPSGGCKRGYMGKNCSTNCSMGHFGFNCNESCDGCLSNSCDKVTGNCTNTTGCNPGWQYGYSRCDIACKNGSYGYNCNETCSGCVSNQCDKIDGNCSITGRCYAGWVGPKCNEPCKLGFFGEDCAEVCHCLYQTCNHISGSCPPGGCKRGYMGDSCSTECKNGNYGFNCTNSCYTCKNSSCERFEGNCTWGCVDEFYGHLCQFQARKTYDSSIVAGSIGGGIVAAVIILVVITVAVVIFRRRYKDENAKYFAGENLTASRIQDTINSNDSLRTETKMNDTNYVNVAGVADSDHVHLLLPSVSGPKNSSTIKTKCSQPVDENKESIIDHVYSNTEFELNSSKYNIAVTDLQSVINEKNISNGFTKEYEILPKGLVRPHAAGSKEENKSKNRFLSTWPYDHSRVVLTGNSSSDYINASYIDRYSKKKAYIATQGPKKNTIQDFWHMIWQENAEVIVMLTRLEEEEGKKKCTQYWPASSDQHLLLGIYKVTLIQETEYTVYVYRMIQILNTVSKQERNVHHFHFSQWPDHGVPDRIKLISFYRKVNLANTPLNGPIVVHCSAGLGRTGTFIAIDALYKNGTKTGYVDILGYVQIMRKNRMNMVQTKEQYKALYEALLEIFTVPDKAIGVDAFGQRLENLKKHPISSTNSLRQEFQQIADLKPVYSTNVFRAANLKENICKNVDHNILAHDNYRPFLMSFEGSRNDYINAVIIMGYEEKTKYLVTQYPLQETVVDFWTMVYDNDCTAVVLLESVANKIALWPEKKESFEFKNFSVKQGLDNFPFSMEIFLHHKKKSDTRTINIMIMNEWTEKNIPRSAKCMLELLDKISQWREKYPGPVAVVCKDGCQRSGVCVSLDLVLEKMNIDNEVDIFQVVRTIQIRRPEFLSNFDQYEYCYNCIKDKLDENESLYANT